MLNFCNKTIWPLLVLFANFKAESGRNGSTKTKKAFYVLLPNIIYVMQSRRFSQYPAFLSQMAKERDKKYIVQSP
jgi:hypothetical protein